jgi:hypothetical protein
MGPETHLYLSAGTALALGGFIWRFSAAQSALQVKVDTLWSFLLRRGEAEGLSAGALQKNSPVTLTPAGAGWFAGGLGADLRGWYAGLKGQADRAGPGLRDRAGLRPADRRRGLPAPRGLPGGLPGGRRPRVPVVRRVPLALLLILLSLSGLASLAARLLEALLDH